MKKRIRDYGIRIGDHPAGALNKLTDVPGVRVGHYTVDTEEHKTGVTVILPCEENIFASRLTAAAFVHNGFGKTAGIPQIEELGTLESPIALTNTLNVGKVHDALVDYMVEQCERDGVELTSMNPVVGECNDASLNKITERVIGIPEVRAAIDGACRDFEEGDVGAGKGTTCFGMKGGIGSASRLVELDGKNYTIGSLVLSNHAMFDDLIVGGTPIQQLLEAHIPPHEDKGSIITVLATDIPLSERQLRRLCHRALVGLSRTGSYCGNGSGEIVLAFTTANRMPHYADKALLPMTMLHDDAINPLFRAVAECVEESVLSSLFHAETVTGYHGKTVPCLTDLLEGKIERKE